MNDLIAFETEQEAIEIANGTEYGLADNVFTGDAKKAMRVKGDPGRYYLDQLLQHCVFRRSLGRIQSQRYRQGTWRPWIKGVPGS